MRAGAIPGGERDGSRVGGEGGGRGGRGGEVRRRGGESRSRQPRAITMRGPGARIFRYAGIVLSGYFRGGLRRYCPLGIRAGSKPALPLFELLSSSPCSRAGDAGSPAGRTSRTDGRADATVEPGTSFYAIALRHPLTRTVSLPPSLYLHSRLSRGPRHT